MPVNDPREVIVDDNETNIHYNGSWLLSNGQNFKGKGINPFSNSLHGTAGKASFTYSFVGSDGRILGMPLDNNDSNSSSSQFDARSPPWQCFLDGTPLPIPPPPDSDSQNDYSWPLCAWDHVQVAPHEIAVHVDNLDDGMSVWFDQLLFVPDPDAIIKNSTVYVRHTDAAIQYESGWTVQNNSHVARSGGASVTFPFNGTALAWYGTMPNDLPQKASIAQFTIDGQSSTNVTVVGDVKHKDRPQTQYDKLIFQTPRLPYGSHTLTVTNEGDIDLAPLVLSYIILDNSELPLPQNLPNGNPTTSSSGTASVPTSTSTSTGFSHHSNNGNINNGSAVLPLKFRVIIGSVIGVLALLFLILLGFLCFRRRQSKRRKQRSQEAGNIPSFLESKRRATVQPPEYPFSQQSAPQLESNGYNFEKRLTYASTRDRPNSLFPVSRLSALPSKGIPSTPRTYHPFSSRYRSSNLSSHSRFTSASSVTLLPHSSPMHSFRSLSDDQTAIMGHRNSGITLPHSRPPEATELPPYTKG